MSDDVITAELVSEVTTVGINEAKPLPPQIVVHAKGTVPTTGWTNPALVRVVYDVVPVDGIQDFDFVADRPEGIVGHIVTEIAAKSDLFDKPEWMKGVRVHAAGNSKEVAI